MSHSKHVQHIGEQKVTFYKRSDILESSYFMRVRLKDEHCYFKKCLKTKDLQQAILLAKDVLAHPRQRFNAKDQVKRFIVKGKQIGVRLRRKIRCILLIAQKGRCYICARSFATLPAKDCCIDHNHETGEIRGLLCNWCNTMLGFAQDNPRHLANASSYLIATGSYG